MRDTAIAARRMKLATPRDKERRKFSRIGVVGHQRGDVQVSTDNPNQGGQQNQQGNQPGQQGGGQQKPGQQQQQPGQGGQQDQGGQKPNPNPQR